jgi:hypothetical protein
MERIEELVARPRESLSVELKAWIDPRTPEGIAKIVKACMALRNRNGGYLLVGFDDRNHSPLTPYPFADPVEQFFHQDAIQSLISRYSSEQFEVRVHFVPLEGMDMPVVEIPTGIRSPAVAKADLKDGREKRLIEANAVYVRSLAANNRVSTTKASWKDYAALMKTCMENREADIGRFVGGISSGRILKRFKKPYP